MNQFTIGTHDGVFHADEVFSIAFIKSMWYGEESMQSLRERDDGFGVIRTRNSTLLEEVDVVVDVGGIYDTASDRYDHHMKEFNELNKYGELLSSFGLVFRSFGKQFLKPGLAKKSRLETFYDKLVRHIDAVDNGLSVFSDGTKPNNTYSQLISAFNPRWDESSSSVKEQEQFNKAVDFASQIILNLKAEILADEKASDELAFFVEVNESKTVLILDRFIPVRRDSVIPESFLFMVYPDRNGNFAVLSIPNNLKDEGFENRKLLPAAWRGLSGFPLAEVSGIPDAVFVHKNGFIGSCGSEESAMIMARAGMWLEQ